MTRNMEPDDTKDLFKPELFQGPPYITRKLSIEQLKSTKIKRSCQIISYIESKRESVRLRRHLLKLIYDEEDAENYDFKIPNNEERRLIKYYYYIHQGVDVMSVAPIQRTWMENISNRVPLKLKLNKIELFNQLMSQVQDDFILSVKKSVVDFALQDFENNYQCNKFKTTNRETLEEIRKKQRSFKSIQSRIQNNLFRIHPTIVRISLLWSQQYKNVRIINVCELYALEALELTQFLEWLSMQVKSCQMIIMEIWIPTLFKIISNIIDKKSFSNIRKNKLKKFCRCLSTLMSLQLQSLCYKTLMEFTKFMCDIPHSSGFRVHVLYKNNKITFSPSFKDFRKHFLSVLGKITDAVSKVPCIDTKLYVDGTDSVADQYLKPSILPEVIENCRCQIENVLESAWICSELKIQDFDEYVCLINEQCRIEVNKFLSEKHPFLMFKEEIAYYHKLVYEISLTCSKVETICTFEIHREHFILILMNRALALKDRFLSRITETYQEACKCLNEEFQDIKDTLLRPPANTTELVQLKLYSLKLGTKVLFEMEDRLREAMSYIIFCSDYAPLKSTEIKQNSVTFLCYRRINGILEENRKIIEKKTQVFQDLLLVRIETFKNNLEKYQKDIDEFQNYRDASKLSKYLKKAQNLHKKLIAAQEHIHEFNQEEIAFGWLITLYPRRDELVEKLSPYKKLYENCADYKNKYQIWTEAKIGTFKPEQIEKDIENFHHNIIELSREFSSSPAPYTLTCSIRLDIEQFQKYMPIVKTLGNPCLKRRHWENISEIVGFPLQVEDNLTLAKILDYGLEEYISKFQTISDSATEENCLEMKLNFMMSEWKEVKFDIVPYRDSDAYILASTDQIQILLDDHIVKTQTMKSSPYIKPFENTIHSWGKKLILLQEIIDSWWLVQKTWIYFEPIFTFSDVQQLIPEESKRFNAADKVWKDVMKAIYANTSVLVVIGIDKILERFGKCIMLLNTIQNGLCVYVDTKRFIFPRFFFLSNKEILSIISNTRDPRGFYFVEGISGCVMKKVEFILHYKLSMSRIQPYLKKCFNGIEKLIFNDDFDITALVSDMNEELRLNEIVDTVSKRGQAEKWLGDLENVMKHSVKKEIKRAISEYKEENFNDWCCNYVQQITFIAYEIISSSEIMKRLSSTALLNEYLEKTTEKLDYLVSHVTSGKEQKKKCALISLIVSSIQIRDHLARAIEKFEDQRRSEFFMTMHYFMECDEVILFAFNTSISYGYEYTGTYLPILLTPAVESSYKSFFLGFKYSFGVLVEGKPGIGKTELVRDFFRRSGRHFVMFTCLPNMDTSILERFFKGVVSSETWLCFDNLDLVNQEGLHIIESYITHIQQAIQFNDRTMKFKNTSYPVSNSIIFATIGKYRSKLPPLLKAYFCRIVFDQADRQQVFELKLRLIGFRNYVSLSNKLENIFKICARLFNSKSYFFDDLRMMDKVFDDIELLKSSDPIANEESILSGAIESTCQSSFRSVDWLLLKKIISLTFGDQNLTSLDEYLSNAVRQACFCNGVVFDGYMYNKVRQLLNVINRSIGIILVGDAFGGKSTLLKILSSVLNSLKDQQLESVVISPNSVTLKQLFGHQDTVTSKWIDGILTKYYRQFSDMRDNSRKLLIFDSPIETSWVENLNSVLDNSRKLCLETGEMIPSAQNLNLIFETTNLDNVSPWTLSKCSIVFVNSELMKWEYIIISWLNTLTSSITEQYKQLIHSMALRFCRPLFHFIFTHCEKTSPSQKLINEKCLSINYSIFNELSHKTL